ncbi:hypothetical protein HID58_075249 [Brassica napus]|uniref:Uncharacterized protein n=1 Tax=Brassica napus TaxID=3708 RepID=A0ABQ7YKS3_BRANA|nr:hypothetical protein HID58_075249 [Brassica napus]
MRHRSEGKGRNRVTAPLKGPDGRVYHSHDGLAPHSHEPIYSPGYFSCRAPSLNDRNFSERAFTVGIGVPVGTGNFEFGVGLQMGTGNWERYSLLQIVVLLLSKAVKVFTEELVPANPDILEDTWKTDEGPQKKRQLLLREDLSHWQNVVTTDLLRKVDPCTGPEKLIRSCPALESLQLKKCCLNDKEGMGASWGIIFYLRWILVLDQRSVGSFLMFYIN